jgi:hypothetical protein
LDSCGSSLTSDKNAWGLFYRRTVNLSELMQGSRCRTTRAGPGWQFMSKFRARWVVLLSTTPGWVAESGSLLRWKGTKKIAKLAASLFGGF